MVLKWRSSAIKTGLKRCLLQIALLQESSGTESWSIYLSIHPSTHPSIHPSIYNKRSKQSNFVVFWVLDILRCSTTCLSTISKSRLQAGNTAAYTWVNLKSCWSVLTSVHWLFPFLLFTYRVCSLNLDNGFTPHFSCWKPHIECLNTSAFLRKLFMSLAAGQIISWLGIWCSQTWLAMAVRWFSEPCFMTPEGIA